MKLFKAVLISPQSPSQAYEQNQYIIAGSCSGYVDLTRSPSGDSGLAAVPGAPPWLLAYLEMAPVFAIPRHPHVLPALQLLYEPLALVTPFCKNGSLEQLLVADRHPRRRAADVSMQERLLWAAQAASGVEELHAHGIVHRDVATRNLLLNSAWEVQVSDFGLSRLLGGGGVAPSPAAISTQAAAGSGGSDALAVAVPSDASDGYMPALQALVRSPDGQPAAGKPPMLLPAPAPRQSGESHQAAADAVLHASTQPASLPVGSNRAAYATTTAGVVPIAWTAPECFASGRFGPPSDVYALGVTLWEIVLGKSPWCEELHRDGPAFVARAVISGRRPPLPKRQVPAPLRSILRRCWAQEPSKRPTAREVRQFLQRQAMVLAADAERSAQATTAAAHLDG